MLRSIFLFALLVGFAAGQEPPPFGTVIEQWNLPMSGGYAGAGITWVRDSGKFFLMDQGFAVRSRARAWELDPADPPGTIESVPWTFVNLGDNTLDVYWGIAWDPDSGCFWMSQIVDGDVYGDCYLLRYVWNSTRWVWAGTPGDSWLVTVLSDSLLYTTGMEFWPGRGLFACPVSWNPLPGLPGLFLLDPYEKRLIAAIGDTACSDRGVTVVPFDSCYILSCGWNRDQFRKHDSGGYLLQAAEALDCPADWTLHTPKDIGAWDTVCAYCITSTPTNTLQRVSLGMLWWQLGSVGVGEKQTVAHSRGLTATVAQGALILPGQTDAEILDITGRKVMSLQPGENDIRHIAPGVYFVVAPSPRPSPPEGERMKERGERSVVSGGRSAVSVRKVLIQR